MSRYWNKRTKTLIPYKPGEQPQDRKFIKLNTNENPYPPSPKVIAAIEEVLAGEKGNSLSKGDRLRLYPDPLCMQFRKAIAGAYGVNVSQVFPCNGSDEVLAFAFGAFFESEILFPDITYSFYPVYADLWDIPYTTIPLQEDFSINIDDYAKASNSGGVILPNPNAPTGCVLPAASLLQLAKKLEHNNNVLIVDEAYISFGAQSLVPYVTDHPNILIVHTLSKSHCLAGLRAGFAIGSEDLIEGLFRVRDSFNSYTMDALAIRGGTAAVLDKAYYDTINQKVINTRERTAAALLAMGFTIVPSKANFLFISYSGIKGQALFLALRERGILARHFNKERISDYIRVSIGNDEDMDIFLAACREIITAMHGGKQ